MPRLDSLEMIARAITPPNRTRRFDARFFMADASLIAHQLEGAETEELLTPAWLTIEEARALDLPTDVLDNYLYNNAHEFFFGGTREN